MHCPKHKLIAKARYINFSQLSSIFGLFELQQWGKLVGADTVLIASLQLAVQLAQLLAKISVEVLLSHAINTRSQLARLPGSRVGAHLLPKREQPIH